MIDSVLLVSMKALDIHIAAVPWSIEDKRASPWSIAV